MTALEKYFKDKTSDEEAMTEEVLGEKLAKKNSKGFFMGLLDALDRPGNATRALLVGKMGGLKGLIPFAQVIEDLTGIDIALNEDERVAGTEVIEKFFGKQKQRKGKLDMVDALGLLVEVVADPLWLVGAGGLSKVGKARSLIGSSVKGYLAQAKVAKSAGDSAKAVMYTKRASDILRAVHTGSSVTVGKKLGKAIKTVAGTKGPSSLRSLSWAKQAARGERGVLNVLGRPVIKGKKTLARAESVANKIRTGAIGKKFLPATARTTIEHGKLHDIFNVNKSAQQYAHGHRLGKLTKSQALQSKIAKSAGLSTEDVGLLGTRLAELGDAPQRYKAIVDEAQRTRSFNNIEFLTASRDRYVGELMDISKQVGDKNMADLYNLAGVRSMADDWLKEGAKYGINLKDVGGDLQYVPRIVTKDYWKKTKGKIFRVTSPEPSGIGVFKGKGGKTREATADMLRKDVDRRMAAPMGAKQMFEGDLATSLAEGSRQHMSRMTQATTINDAIKQFGKPISGKIDDGYVSISNVLKKMDDAKLPTLKNLPANKQIPMDVADSLFNSFNQVIRSQEDIAFTGLVEGAQRLMKGAYTVPFPAFHGRNAVSNKILNWLEGTWRPGAYVDSFNLQKAAAQTRRVMKKENIEFMDAAKKVKWPDITVNGVKRKGYEVFDLADREGVLGRTIGIFDPEEVAGGTFHAQTKGVKKWAGGQDPITKTGRMVGSTIEDHDRLAHFIDKLSDGMSSADAAKSTKTALFDYGDLSDFEKKWMRDRLFFFYTFARKNITQQSRKLLQQPAKQSLFAHLAGGTPRVNAPRPDWQQERLNIPLPFRNKEGLQYEIKGLGSPIEEAFGSLGAPGTTMWNRASKGVNRQVSRLNPMITTPIELATKKNLFFDSDIQNVPEWMIGKSPLGRVYGTYKGFKKGRDSVASKATGFTTGIRFHAPDPVQQKTYKMRQIARDYLAANKQTKTYKRYYTPTGVDGSPLVNRAMELQ